MSDKQKESLKNLADTFKKLDENQQNLLTGIATGMAMMKPEGDNNED